MAIYFVAQDTGSVLKVNLSNTSTGTPIDLTNCSVQLKYRGQASGPLLTKTMTIATPATAGQVTYQWQSGELVTGTYVMEVAITDIQGLVLTTVNQETIEVRART